MCNTDNLHHYLLFEDANADGERRTIEVITKSGTVDIIERTSGPDTLAAYGDSAHSIIFHMDERAADKLCVAMQTTSVASWLQEILVTKGELWLSDVQDVLDCMGIPYVRCALGPDGSAYIPTYFNF